MRNLITILLLTFGLGMGTAQSTQTMPSNKKTEVRKERKNHKKGDTSVKFKKDGTPDKRYKQNKKLKKDGTPDKRYKQNKK